MNTTDLKHYESPEWNFALDVPMCWNTAPAVPANSPYELIRFVSHEDGNHLTIIFREPFDPKRSLKQHAEQRQQILAQNGYGGFAGGEATIQSKPAWRLDFDRPGVWGIWSRRYYFVAEKALLYRVGFGTSDKAGMFRVFDRVAKSFKIITQ